MPFITMVPPAAPPSLAWPDTADKLQTLLKISFDIGKIECHGTTTKHAKCKQRVAAAKITSIKDLLNRIVKTGGLLAAKTLLQELAPLIMCLKYHQHQASEHLQRWTLALSKIPKSEVKHEDAIDTRDETTKREVVEALITLRQIIKQRDSASPKIKSEELEDTPMELRPPPIPELQEQEGIKSSQRKTRRGRRESGERTADGRKPQSNSKAKTKPKVEPKPKHVFVPFGPAKSTYKLNRAIKEKIQRKLLPSEAPKSNGIIYVYTFPDNYRQPSPFLKIGHTTDVDRRMRDWQRQCGYEPKKICDSNVELSIKVESLVHANLYNSRKKEEGGCPQCKVVHKEWFDVKYNKAANVIALWTDWSRRQPYDEDGVLEPRWQKRLDEVDLDDPDCWESFVNDDFEEESEDEETDSEWSDEYSDGCDDESEDEDDDDYNELWG